MTADRVRLVGVVAAAVPLRRPRQLVADRLHLVGGGVPLSQLADRASASPIACTWSVVVLPLSRLAGLRLCVADRPRYLSRASLGRFYARSSFRLPHHHELFCTLKAYILGSK